MEHIWSSNNKCKLSGCWRLYCCITDSLQCYSRPDQYNRSAIIYTNFVYHTALTNITIATTGATGIGAAAGLPAGVIAVWAANVITISGTPTAVSYTHL